MASELSRVPHNTQRVYRRFESVAGRALQSLSDSGALARGSVELPPLRPALHTVRVFHLEHARLGRLVESISDVARQGAMKSLTK